jgi:hypothetical protein
VIQTGPRCRTPADSSVKAIGGRHGRHSSRHSARRHPEQYDAVRAEAGWLEQVPEGGIAHLTWWEGADCHNIDGWDSEAAFAASGERRLGPAMAAVGLTVQPEAAFYPAYEIYLPQRATIAPTLLAHAN